MSSFMRTVERQKIRTQMEKQGVSKKNKKLKPWWDAYKEEKHKYLERKKNKENQNDISQKS